MSLLFSFLLSLTLAVTTSAHAELPYLDKDFGCTSAADAERYISDFRIDLETFGGRELCNNAKDTKKLLNDLTLIEKTEFGAPVNHPFIRGFVDRTNYYGWMRSQTRGVNRGRDVPYATAYNRGGYFTMQDGWALLSTLGRVGTIIHEARHTAGYSHYICTTGPYANSEVEGCDTSYAQGGSHAVEMEYYARAVLESKNLNPVYQSMARLMAIGRSNFVFNEKPMQPREALLALTDNKAVLVDGNERKSLAAPEAHPGDHLKRTSFGASVFDGTRASAIDVYGPSSPALSDDFSYYKLFKGEALPVAQSDVEEIDVNNIRYLAVLARDGAVYSYHFPEGEWWEPSMPLANPNGSTFVTLTPSGQKGLFAVRGDGSIVPFDLVNRNFLSPLPERWPAGVAAYAESRGRQVALLGNGMVVDKQGNEAPELAGEHVQSMVNIPLYDAFQVAP